MKAAAWPPFVPTAAMVTAGLVVAVAASLNSVAIVAAPSAVYRSAAPWN